MSMRKTSPKAGSASARGQVRLGILTTVVVALLVFLLVYLWIRSDSRRAENVIYNFIANSHLAEDLLEGVAEVDIDFGDPSSQSYGLEGFSDKYEVVEEATTAWAVGIESLITFELEDLSEKLVSLRCMPYTYESLDPDLKQSIAITVNEKYLTTIDLDSGWSEYNFILPASYLGPGTNVMEFEYAYAAVPAEVAAEEDTRPLSVNFDYLRIRNPNVRKAVLLDNWTIQNQTKSVIAASQDEFINYYLEIPQGARLRFDFGIHPDAFSKLAAVTYKIVVQPDDDSEPQDLVNKTLEGETLRPAWFSEDVDFARYARRLVRIRFQVSTPDDSELGPKAWAGWANPRLILEKDKPASPTESGKSVVEAGPKGKYNILIIFLDGLRADHTSYLGYYRATTDKIDTLARESVYFSQAISPSNLAFPAHVSVFTGLYPYMHGIRSVNKIAARSSLANWVADLKAHGENYVTTAFVEDPDLAAYYKALGFQTPLALAAKAPSEASESQEPSEEPSAPAASENPSLDRLTNSLEAVQSWLQENANEHFFLVYQTNFLLPPFMPPIPYGQMFYPEYYVDPDRVLGQQVNEKMLEKIHKKELELDESDIKQFQALYDGKVRYLDIRIGEMLKRMNELGLGKNTILVLTSGQGLQLGEHGLVGALGQTLYNEEIRVPLIMRFPDSFKLAPKPVNLQVRLLDIMPTILHALGMSPSSRLSGVSLLPLIKGQSMMDLPAVSESTSPPLMSLRTNEWKVFGSIVGTWLERPALFNMWNDPGELDDYIKQRPVLGGYLGQKLDGRLAHPDKTY